MLDKASLYVCAWLEDPQFTSENNLKECIHIWNEIELITKFTRISIVNHKVKEEDDGDSD